MWCWGADIRMSEGNALIRAGFSREPVAEGTRGSSSYRREIRGGCTLVLWGSGLCLASRCRGRVALPRSDFRPTYDPDDSLSLQLLRAGFAPSFGPPEGEAGWESAADLVAEALDAIADYERWAGEYLGAEYRNDCLRGRRRSLPGSGTLAPHWLRLAGRWRALCSDA
jgi:hypothetical protein